jgi:hypothetical protein
LAGLAAFGAAALLFGGAFLVASAMAGGGLPETRLPAK